MNKAGAEDAARIARAVAGCGGDELERHQQEHEPKRHLAIQCQADIAITDPQNLRHKPSHHAHQQAAGGRLQPLAPLGQLPESAGG